MVTYEIRGTKFLVDVNKGILQEIDDPENVIPFHALDNMDTHYEANYIVPGKSLYSVFYQGDMANVERVKIPQMTALDAEGVAQEYGMELEQVKGKSDY